MATEQELPPLDLGRVVCTPAAMQVLEEHAARHQLEARMVVAHLIGRHAAHDWGTIDAEDAKANTRALIEGTRVLSAYTLDGRAVWVITDGERDDGTRECTTILLPEDY